MGWNHSIWQNALVALWPALLFKKKQNSVEVTLAIRSKILKASHNALKTFKEHHWCPLATENQQLSTVWLLQSQTNQLQGQRVKLEISRPHTKKRRHNSGSNCSDWILPRRHKTWRTNASIITKDTHARPEKICKLPVNIPCTGQNNGIDACFGL